MNVNSLSQSNTLAGIGCVLYLQQPILHGLFTAQRCRCRTLADVTLASFLLASTPTNIYKETRDGKDSSEFLSIPCLLVLVGTETNKKLARGTSVSVFDIFFRNFTLSILFPRPNSST